MRFEERRGERLDDPGEMERRERGPQPPHRRKDTQHVADRPEPYDEDALAAAEDRRPTFHRERHLSVFDSTFDAML